VTVTTFVADISEGHWWSSLRFTTSTVGQQAIFYYVKQYQGFCLSAKGAIPKLTMSTSYCKIWMWRNLKHLDWWGTCEATWNAVLHEIITSEQLLAQGLFILVKYQLNKLNNISSLNSETILVPVTCNHHDFFSSVLSLLLHVKDKISMRAKNFSYTVPLKCNATLTKLWVIQLKGRGTHLTCKCL